LAKQENFELTTLYLVRHGDKIRAAGDFGLTELGKRQARAVAAYFATLPITKLYSSPLQRAQETAQAISQRIGLPIQIEPRLRERLNWGDVPEHSREEFINDWYQASAERNYVPRGGDSSRATGERVNDCLQEFAARFPNDHIVCVMHGGALADWLLNTFDETWLHTTYPEFELVPPASITKIIAHENQFSIVEFARVVYTETV
jgi:broad specificity phosphatase PhoE